jgi:hypothetical protein
MRTRKRLLTKRNPKKITNISVKKFLDSLRRKKDNELLAKQSAEADQNQNQ